MPFAYLPPVLATLATALPASALNVQPANEAERTSLLHMLQRLASSSGRKELIAEVAAEQQELDARMESSVFAQELEQHHASSEVQSLVFALDNIHVRCAERCTNWTVDEHLELIAKVHRCQAPDSTLLQKDIRVGAHAADDGCKQRVQFLREQLHRDPNLTKFLPKTDQAQQRKDAAAARGLSTDAAQRRRGV